MQVSWPIALIADRTNIRLQHLGSIFQIILQKRSSSACASTEDASTFEPSLSHIEVVWSDLLIRTSIRPSLSSTDCTAVLQDSSELTSS